MEKVIFKGKVSKKIFVIPGILAAIFFIEAIVFLFMGGSVFLFPFCLGSVIIAPAVIKYSCTELTLYNKKIRGQVGFISKESLDAPLEKINDVYVSQGIIGRMLGYGNINISTSSNNFHFKGIADCTNFKNKIIEQIEIYKKDEAEENARVLAEALKNNK